MSKIRQLSFIAIIFAFAFSMTQCQLSNPEIVSTQSANQEIDLPLKTPTNLPEEMSNTSPDNLSSQVKFTSLVGKVVFVSERDGNKEIYSIDFNTNQESRFTNNNVIDTFPQWSPDGKHIIFISGRDGNLEVYMMDATGNNQRNLSQNPASDGQARWSPDGKYIIFVSDRDGNEEIYRMNVDGTAQIRLTNNTAKDSEPIWSPDGERILFTSYRDGNAEIYIMNQDGSEQTRMTDNPATDNSPSWSPDGKYIVFSSSRGYPEDVVYVNSSLYMMKADGSQIAPLTNNPSSNTSPVWSPDGKYIAFVSDRDSVRGRVSKIYLMDMATREVTRLTDDDMTAYPVPHELAPTWSPDGQYLAFTLDNGTPQIYVFHIQSGQMFPLTTGNARNYLPHWWGP